jgi:hypothetical protein
MFSKVISLNQSKTLSSTSQQRKYRSITVPPNAQALGHGAEATVFDLENKEKQVIKIFRDDTFVGKYLRPKHIDVMKKLSEALREELEHVGNRETVINEEWVTAHYNGKEYAAIIMPKLETKRNIEMIPDNGLLIGRAEKILTAADKAEKKILEKLKLKAIDLVDRKTNLRGKMMYDDFFLNTKKDELQGVDVFKTGPLIISMTRHRLEKILDLSELKKKTSPEIAVFVEEMFSRASGQDLVQIESTLMYKHPNDEITGPMLLEELLLHLADKKSINANFNGLLKKVTIRMGPSSRLGSLLKKILPRPTLWISTKDKELDLSKGISTKLVSVENVAGKFNIFSAPNDQTSPTDGFLNAIQAFWVGFEKTIPVTANQR